MARSIELVLYDLNALTAWDFEYSNPNGRGILRLDELCEELIEANRPDMAAPAMFDVMERLDGEDLGMPGPLVHTLESWGDKYQRFLVESMRRKPSSMAVWMVNRILNASSTDFDMWIGLLKEVLTHPLASDEAKVAARRALAHQGVE